LTAGIAYLLDVKYPTPTVVLYPVSFTPPQNGLKTVDMKCIQAIFEKCKIYVSKCPYIDELS
jgi:hypothetical protein